ncbi:pyridoxamine 5'-phosphate oxidase family protein [Amnibacterium kyonggiense]|uniref:Pyridoxamine 5'-phosphate oxidase-like protein n=1 Tax=Amnibacterium kyonggiense TaxID=595671 RepID=A0A4V3EAJ1_9MICO|nr:pyridoxamine 5'-phosphate oxidase family protein [Amnibacterium kyonggiense]TDS76834.1 pyridoxamine 5'-phosphate oxidase-like protein [Amnibacterium kyonggiense]
MSDVESDPVALLTEEDCWALLERGALGRLAVAVDGVVDLYPVNYAVDRRRILFKTNPGTKLAALTVNRHVAFEIDGTDEQSAWSVVVKGEARPLETMAEQFDAERLPIVSWLPTAKSRVVVLVPTSVSGRGFLRGEEPDAAWY